MAKSISQAQGRALALGFLDKIGGNSDDFQPVRTLGAFYNIAGVIVEEAQANLNKSDRVSSGALSDSIIIIDPVEVDGKIAINISAAFYWKFVDKGVKGYRGRGNSTEGYKFKNGHVSKKMMQALRQWVIREGIKAKTNVGGKPITDREKKRKSITDTSASTAYAIGFSIKRNGLKKTGFMTKAIKTGERAAKKLLGQALVIDIADSLPKQL